MRAPEDPHAAAALQRHHEGKLPIQIGNGKNGRYFTLTDPAAAKRRWPRVALCGICKRLDPGEAKAVESVISASNRDPER